MNSNGYNTHSCTQLASIGGDIVAVPCSRAEVVTGFITNTENTQEDENV